MHYARHTFATVCHDHGLRNPLEAIGMAAHNIKREADNNPDFDRQLNTINKKIDESDQIIDNLLFYSRLLPCYILFKLISWQHP